MPEKTVQKEPGKKPAPSKKPKPQQEVVVQIPLSELHPFPDHPFQVREDASMQETAESVKEYGVLVPALARPREDGGYELIAGHRRKHACELAGLATIEVTDQNIGSFNRIARKYGIDFAPFKVKGEKRYMVFFKAPDADAMTAAFKEYTAKQVRKAERPSVLEKLQHFKSLIQAAVVDRTKRKELER